MCQPAFLCFFFTENGLYVGDSGLQIFLSLSEIIQGCQLLLLLGLKNSFSLLQVFDQRDTACVVILKKFNGFIIAIQFIPVTCAKPPLVLGFHKVSMNRPVRIVLACKMDLLVDPSDLRVSVFNSCLYTS